METTTALDLGVQLDAADSPHDILELMTWAPFAAGRYPVSRSTSLPQVRIGASLLPPGAEPARVAETDGKRTVLAEGDGWLLCSTRWRDLSAHVVVVARTEALAVEITEAATAGAAEPVDESGDTVTISFWHVGSNGKSRRVDRSIAAGPWGDIRRNYTAPAAVALDGLMGIEPDGLDGRLLLLHGPPGTGKTTAFRALARAWRDWCSAEVVIDPERLFVDPAYLSTVLLGDADEDDDEDRWRLLLLEDCDELIRADAKQATGQALARLLNVADGLLGQGLRLLIALSTNERLGELHPAVTRPGRCLAEIFVGPLTHREAVAWLGPGHPAPGGSATLAELFASSGAIRRLQSVRPAVPTGAYL